MDASERDTLIKLIAGVTSEEIDEWEETAFKATLGPYRWNTYSNIYAEGVERDDPWNEAGEGEKPLAIIATIAQEPKDYGNGDQLHSLQARANAEYVEMALNMFPFLLYVLRLVKESSLV